jgi:hypothetical protein
LPAAQQNFWRVRLKQLKHGRGAKKKNPRVPIKPPAFKIALSYLARWLFDEPPHVDGGAGATLKFVRLDISIASVWAIWLDSKGDQRSFASGVGPKSHTLGE